MIVRLMCPNVSAVKTVEKKKKKSEDEKELARLKKLVNYGKKSTTPDQSKDTSNGDLMPSIEDEILKENG